MLFRFYYLKENTRVFDTSDVGTMTITPNKAEDTFVVTGKYTTDTPPNYVTPLNYVPEAGDAYQIRVKFENITALSGPAPILRLYFADEKGKLDTENDYLELKLNPQDVSSNAYHVYTIAITPKMASTSKIFAIAPYFGHLNTENANAKMPILVKGIMI